jgi:hypothetical protein
MPVTAEPEWLRAGVKSRDIGVDRENRVILGFVVAQEGPFKSEGRGEFDDKSLKKIVTLMRQNEGGTKARFGHPTLSDDGLGKYLGRAKNPRLDTVTVKRDGGIVSLLAVRADLHIAEVAMQPSASGFSLGEHVLDRAEEDPDSFSSSLVLRVDTEERLDKDGRPLLDANGQPLPPLWRPLAIHATDVVDTGDAVDGFLSAELGLPDAMLRQGYDLFMGFLPNSPRDVVEARLQSWLGKALDARFGELLEKEPESKGPTAADMELMRRHKRRVRVAGQAGK